MIYDTFTYNGERDILDIHLNVLDKHVDRFIVVEAKTTFSGRKKPLYFSQHETFFKKFWDKMDYFIIDEDYSPQEIQMAEASPNTIGAPHWKNEFLQKESIKKALVGLHDDDTVFIGDVDEIWDAKVLTDSERFTPIKLKLHVYAYYLNNASSENFAGTLLTTYAYLKDSCLNHLRTQSKQTNHHYGWHFTSMGGVNEVRRKLDDSYTEESYNTKEVQTQLSARVQQGTDYLGRPFTFTLDESEWPEYLIKKRRKYEHLCK